VQPKTKNNKPSLLEDVLDKIQKVKHSTEDNSEMNFWETVASCLTQEEQTQLLQSLNGELSETDKN